MTNGMVENVAAGKMKQYKTLTRLYDLCMYDLCMYDLIV